MNLQIAFEVWDELVAVSLGVALIASVAAVLARYLRGARERRAAWQLALVAMFALLVAEFTGLNAALPIHWREPRPQPNAPPIATAAPHAPTSVTASRVLAPQVSETVSDAIERRWPVEVLWLVWPLGSVLVMTRVAIAHCLLARLRRRLRPVACPELANRVSSLAQRAGVGAPLTVGESLSVSGPLVFGLRRPTLVLPARFKALLTRPQQDAVIMHELAHIRARDAVWCLVADVVTALAWWHPLTWWARSRVAIEMEAAADEASLTLDATGPIWLAEALVQFGRVTAERRWPSALASRALGHSSLGRRVTTLLALKPGARFQRVRGLYRWGMPALFAVAATVALCIRPMFAEGSDSMRTGSGFWRHSMAGSLLALVFSSTGEPAIVQLGEPVIQGGAASAPRAEKTEAKAADAIGLSAEQREAFDELVQEKDKRNKAFMARRPHNPAEGLELNKWWNGELKKLFSEEQYEKYVAYWTDPNQVVAVPVVDEAAAPSAKAARAFSPARIRAAAGRTGADAAAGRAQGGPPDFKAMENEILEQLELSDVQKEKIAEFQAELEKVNAQFKELSLTGSGAEIAKRGDEINKKVRSTMQSILTKAQYAKYQELWNQKLGGARAGSAQGGPSGAAAPGQRGGARISD